MEAPERIWINYAAANKVDLAYDEPPITPFDDVSQEYVRADLAALEAPDAGVVAELVEALREARADLAAYVDHDYPPETCATYSSVARQHHRDMELCRMIDAVLAKLETSA